MSFIEIATKEGCMYTKWGPCFCSEQEQKDGNFCIACQNAQRIKDEGLDWDAEYAEAAKNNFNAS